MSYDGHFQIPDSSGSCLNSYVKVHSQKTERPNPVSLNCKHLLD